MAYSDTSICIYLINNDSSQKADDVVIIRKNLDNGDFDITYKDQNNGSPVTHVANGLYRARVIDYLYMLFKNQALDEEAYKSVQLTLPAMPRIIVSGDKFKDLYYREHFLEAVGNSLDMLENVSVKNKFQPVPREDWGYQSPASRRSTAPGVVPQHLFFDDASA
jgi:hypothetical protein